MAQAIMTAAVQKSPRLSISHPFVHFPFYTQSKAKDRALRDRYGNAMVPGPARITGHDPAMTRVTMADALHTRAGITAFFPAKNTGFDDMHSQLRDAMSVITHKLQMVA